jgi:hypothetical protein
MVDGWDTEETAAEQARQIVAGLIRLASDEEAGRLLGIDGTLEDELDVAFLTDPLAWIANEIAGAIRAEEDDDEVISLSSLVAMLRLYRTLRGGHVDHDELLNAVLDYLQEEEEEEEGQS